MLKLKKIITLTILTLLVGIFPRFESQKLTAAPSLKYTRNGKASWYSRKSPGINKRTANNEIFNDQDLTCAIWGVEFNRYIRVTNLDNGKSVIVRVNDRGPHKRYVKKGRVIDLTLESFSRLGVPKAGLINVEIEFL